ncbi:MAG: 4a-hydroxytetrahydrobiopterin dehydratase [Nitrospiraceae bacterium]
MAFANKVGAVAESEGHHPDLYVAWGKCKVEIWTHKINGLTESDFYLAAKADREFEPFRAAMTWERGEARTMGHRGIR